VKERLLVAFVDALGPRQVMELAPPGLTTLPHQRALAGYLGYSSGALASILTGAAPSVHGRMCLFSSHGGHGSLAPLRWLGLLPRVLHERSALRRRVAKVFAMASGLNGYFALHRVPPDAFQWLEVEERDDLFQTERVGRATTFLSRARAAGVEVFASPWQLEEDARWHHTFESIRRRPAELTFVYASALDGALHHAGNESASARGALRTISDRIDRARDLLSRDGSKVTTLVVGDHGMADVEHVVDPRSLVSRLAGVRVFVDSTLLRLWGSDGALAEARCVLEGALPHLTFLAREALAREQLPVEGSPYGDAIGVLPEGHLFSPSFVGGRVRGMHGYHPSGSSAEAALLADFAIPPGVRSISDVASLVDAQLGLS
jgi:hypothetical protein